MIIRPGRRIVVVLVMIMILLPILTGACSESRYPRTPLVDVRNDSLLIDLDDRVSYDDVAVLLLFGDEHFNDYYSDAMPDFSEGGRFTIPLEYWHRFDAASTKYEHPEPGRKPDMISIAVDIPDGSGVLWNIMLHNNQYLLLNSEGANAEGERVPELNRAMPDSLKRLLANRTTS
ncbi:hypothetical protein KQI65_05255 [bacterium]|nr:hypothetical protein [bacterium]